MIGTTIEQYKVLSKLGEGGMGTVYGALDVNLDRPVALKFLNSAIDNRPDMLERFRSEARMHASLHHPNIATLYAFFVWAGKAVMVMEYINGETLASRLQRVGIMPPAESCGLIQQALLGLDSAHRQGIIHRDIKPQNLMIDETGVLKVMDFGIAKVQGVTGLTSTNMVMGTSWYMAPEQIRMQPVDARTDIYSMGVTLYQVLTGQMPFQANSEYDIQKAHIEQMPPLPNTRNPLVPEHIARATMKALAKAPADRFQSADEFHAALAPERAASTSGGTVQLPRFHPETVFEGAPKFPGSSPGPQVPSPQPPDRTPWLLGVIAVLLAGIGSAFWYHSAHGDKPAPEPVPKTSPAENAKTPTQPPAKPPVVPPGHRLPHPLPAHDPGTLPMLGAGGPAPLPPKPADTETLSKPISRPVSPGLPAGQELSGTWSGAFTDPGTRESTAVLLTLAETSPEAMSGSMHFTTATQSSGNCQVSPHTRYEPTAHRLTLTLVHCDGPERPAYFNVPVQFNNVRPGDAQLTDGHPQYLHSDVTADLKKH